jgi:hypothetical protein
MSPQLVLTLRPAVPPHGHRNNFVTATAKRETHKQIVYENMCSILSAGIF